jgi:hypothetical protein
MTRKKVTSLEHERELRGLPVERWRRGIYALLVTKPKAGIVKAFRRKKRGS